MRFAVLDGWRGICALVVALHHFHADGYFFHLPFVRGAWLFVDFFFVLSGFVIAHAYGKRLNGPPDFLPFVARRLARLWPLHAVILLLLVVMETTKLVAMLLFGIEAHNQPFSGETSSTAIITNMLLIHAMGLHDGATWNFPSWSISTEFWTYLAFAAVCLARRQRDVWWLMIISGGAAILVAIESPEWLHTIADFGLFRCLFGFFLGALTHCLLLGRLGQTLPGATWLEVAAVTLVVVFVSQCTSPTALSMAAPLVFAIALSVFAFAQGTLSRLLLLPPARALGRWSYSIYMVHTLVLVAFGRIVNLVEAAGNVSLTVPHQVNGASRVLLVLGQPWVSDIAALAYLMIVVALSALTWHWIERPCQAMGGQWASAWRSRN